MFNWAAPARCVTNLSFVLLRRSQVVIRTGRALNLRVFVPACLIIHAIKSLMGRPHYTEARFRKERSSPNKMTARGR